MMDVQDGWLERWKFYSSIIKEEKKTFKIENDSLKLAAETIDAYHSINSLGDKQSFLPSTIYDEPPNRCSYLYRYATINTGVVTKYFQRLALETEVKNTLYLKKAIKICCLGGGPGTDVFGVFRALADDPNFHGKITEVSVLDICSGWENTFNSVISGLLEGKVKSIPTTFTNRKVFRYKFLTVNLLDYLPQNVREIISNADIVCMTEFVSELLGDKRSSTALKVLGNLIKLEALVLFIDVFDIKVFELSEVISKANGFETVLGPLHERFKDGCRKQEKDIYGYNPQFATKFSVVGWRKASITSIVNKVFDKTYYSISNNSNTESEGSSLEVFEFKDKSTALEVLNFDENNTALEEFNSKDKSVNEPLRSLCHTHTQTEADFLTLAVSSENEEMQALMTAVSNLLNITEQWKQQIAIRKCCCCHQSC